MEANGLTIFGGVFVGYLVGYTAYSKSSRKLEMDQLQDVLLVRRGWDHTLVELNKALSLAGLTCLSLSYLPSVPKSREVFTFGINSLLVHSTYSLYKFYGDKHIPGLSTWPRIFQELFSKQSKERAEGIKKVSVVLGSLGLMAGVASSVTGDYGGLAGVVQKANVFDIRNLALVSLGLGLAHFLSMEVDYKLRLQVRPFAYLAVILPLVGLFYGYKGRSP